MAWSNTKAKTAKTSVRSRSKTTKSSSARASSASVSRRKLSGGFRVGDLVTGLDRSYQRSIYKVLGKGTKSKSLLLEFVSLRDDVIDRWKDTGAGVLQYQCERRSSEFRKANRKEIKASKRARAIYYLNKLFNRLGLQRSL